MNYMNDHSVTLVAQRDVLAPIVGKETALRLGYSSIPSRPIEQ